MSAEAPIVEDLANHVAQQTMQSASRAVRLLETQADRVLLLELVSGALVGMAGAERLCNSGRDATSVSPVEQNAAMLDVLASLRDAIPPDDHRNPREPLPARRPSAAIDFHWQNGAKVYTVGFSLCPGDDWRVAEIFLNISKSEGMAEANARDAGILASFALQHGATLEQLVAAVTHEPDGTASSIVGTALNLVQAEIKRLREDGGDPDDGVAAPQTPIVGPGDGGANAAVPTQGEPTTEPA